MTVPKEIAEKAEHYEMLKKEADKLYEELEFNEGKVDG